MLFARHSAFHTVHDEPMAKSKQSSEGFPERLRKARMQKGLSQVAFAKAAGIHFNQISRYEQGNSQPTIDRIRKMASVLGVSEDYLINGETANAARGNIEDREILEMFQQVQKLPPKDKDYVRRFLHSVINQTKLEEMTAK